MLREDILDKAKECVCGRREQDYGSPEDNFQAIANLWTAYKLVNFSSEDVAMMMALLKIARIRTGKGTDDSFVDLAGYAACGGEIASKRLYGRHTEQREDPDAPIASVPELRFQDEKEVEDFLGSLRNLLAVKRYISIAELKELLDRGDDILPYDAKFGWKSLEGIELLRQTDEVCVVMPEPDRIDD